jgi:hypothetical protein
MTGPEHYLEAEQLAARAESWTDFDRYPLSLEERAARRAGDLAAAQVHATLALAAAQSTAFMESYLELETDDAVAWSKAVFR